MARVSAHDKLLHDRLRAAHERNVISIFTDFRVLNTPGSPVFNPWESVMPLLGLLLFAIVILLLGGILVGMAALAFGLAVYAFVVRGWLARQVYARTVITLMVDAKSFQSVWDHGGVVLAMTDRPQHQVRAPRGSWRTFVDRYLPQTDSAESLAEDMRGGGFGSDRRLG
ncbi:hypothetical protein ACM64Y_04430 [Novispirillum sp. DQ9]|uniref:hypothetical protein n=1 Tax=Novispirillum sp. DQ9 TaxID=3398612 RepID=UPI003C79AB67